MITEQFNLCYSELEPFKEACKSVVGCELKNIEETGSLPYTHVMTVDCAFNQTFFFLGRMFQITKEIYENEQTRKH